MLECWAPYVVLCSLAPTSWLTLITLSDKTKLPIDAVIIEMSMVSSSPFYCLVTCQLRRAAAAAARVSRNALCCCAVVLACVLAGPVAMAMAELSRIENDTTTSKCRHRNTAPPGSQRPRVISALTLCRRFQSATWETEGMSPLRVVQGRVGVHFGPNLALEPLQQWPSDGQAAEAPSKKERGPAPKRLSKCCL